MESDQLNLKLPLPTAYCHNRVLLNLLLQLRVSPPKHLTCSMQRLSLLCVERAHGQLMRAPPARRRSWCNSSAARKEGQRRLVCCSPWGCKELDASYRWNDNSSLGRECFNSACPCASLLAQLQVNHERMVSSYQLPQGQPQLQGTTSFKVKPLLGSLPPVTMQDGGTQAWPALLSCSDHSEPASSLAQALSCVAQHPPLLSSMATPLFL